MFHTLSILVILCAPEADGPARKDLIRPQREVRRLVTSGGGVQFHPSHGEWIKILRSSGLVIEALYELYAAQDAADHPYYSLATAEWARQWPAEEIWVAHLAGRRPAGVPRA